MLKAFAMRISTISDGWKFCMRGERPWYYRPAVAYLDWQAAQVPGAVHLDLMRAGVIDDPFRMRNEVGLRWVDEADWSYRTEFGWNPDSGLPRRVIRFEALDSPCEVWLNGDRVAIHDNRFVPLEIEVTERLESGANELRVEFESAVRVGDRRRSEYFARHGLPNDTPFFDERAFVRKAQYMSGWDWGPRFVACGISGPVTLLEFESRIVRASVLQEKAGERRFRVWIDAEVDGPGAPAAQFGDIRRAAGEPLEFAIESPDLWWPHGEGGQPLYEARVSLAGGHEVVTRIGLRSIELVRQADDLGRSFEFSVNGRRVFSRGANWIPNDSFVARDSDEAIAAQIELCRRLGMNMLRVWGGGYIESEAFYDACDQAGILVWQDFPYACSYYPDDESHLAEAEREAREAVLRLRDRTCLALWCGNNENSAMWQAGWGGTEHRPPRFHGEAIYEQVLPKVVQELDPDRAYIPSSPLDPAEESSSDSHYWDAWHGRGDWIHYRDSQARFASEFGFASSCSLACWGTVIDAGEAEPRSASVRWHDKTTKPVDVFEGFVAAHYPAYANLEDWVYFSQLNQRDALACAIEHYRRGGFCRGTLIWQFNDCWPVQSWAVQDYRRLLKPAGFELARLYAPILISLQIAENEARVHVVNDGPDPAEDRLIVGAIDSLTGTSLGSWDASVSLASGGRNVFKTIPVGSFERSRTVLRARFRDAVAWSPLCEPKELRLSTPRIAVRVDSQLEVKAEGFVRDLVIWDTDDPGNVFDLETGQSGWRAVTLANESFEWGLRRPPARLCARSLHGRHELAD